MDNGVYYSSTCFNVNNVDELIDLATQHQLFNLELSGNLAFDDKVEKKLNKLNQFTFLIHNYFPRPKEEFVLNLASNNQKIRQASINHCLKSIKLCQNLKLPFYSVHAGFLMDLKPQDLGKKQSHLPYIVREGGFQLFKKSIVELLDFAQNKVDLLVENNVVSQKNMVNNKNKHYLLADIEETKRFFKEINHPRLGLLADLGHLKVSAEQLKFDKNEYLDSLKDYVRAFHLSDNNGIEDLGLVFNKQAWFIPLLKQRQHKQVVKIVEINKKNSISDLKKSIKIVDGL